MIPGKSRIWIFAPLYMTCPGTVVKVVNSYAAATHDYQYFFFSPFHTKTRGSSRTFGMLASQSTHQCTLPHGREANESPSIGVSISYATVYKLEVLTHSRHQYGQRRNRLRDMHVSGGSTELIISHYLNIYSPPPPPPPPEGVRSSLFSFASLAFNCPK